MATSARRRFEMWLHMYKPEGGGDDQPAVESKLMGI
jgi:hypothetical protein